MFFGKIFVAPSFYMFVSIMLLYIFWLGNLMVLLWWTSPSRDDTQWDCPDGQGFEAAPDCKPVAPDWARINTDLYGCPGCKCWGMLICGLALYWYKRNPEHIPHCASHGIKESFSLQDLLIDEHYFDEHEVRPDDPIKTVEDVRHNNKTVHRVEWLTRILVVFILFWSFCQSYLAAAFFTDHTALTFSRNKDEFGGISAYLRLFPLIVGNDQHIYFHQGIGLFMGGINMCACTFLVIIGHTYFKLVLMQIYF